MSGRVETIEVWFHVLTLSYFLSADSLPRGTPQISITFDIDADGIVNVSAVDKATNKEQAMTIASSSGLSDKEIERMVAESEAFAEQDKQRRLVIEESNKGESFCVDTEKGEPRRWGLGAWNEG